MGRSKRQNKKRTNEKQSAKNEEQRALPSTNALKYDGGLFHQLNSAMKFQRERFHRIKVALMKLLWTSDKESVLEGEPGDSPAHCPKTSRWNADELSSPDSVKWASNPQTFKTQIESVFKPHMKQKGLPLLKDLDSYLAHLPRREDSVQPEKPLILYECPYYVAPADLERFAKSLLSVPDELRGARAAVRSIVAPSGAGKSAAVLPAFLEMQKLEPGSSPIPSMYIYMPFYNNCGRSHLPPVFLSIFPQFLQYSLGQAYMLCCFRLMLHGKYYRCCLQVLIWFFRALIAWAFALICACASFNGDFFRGEYSGLWQHRLQQLVTQAVGKENRILVHVDEHFAMSQNPVFRQGALSILASFDTRLLVVTTFTEVTFEFASKQCSDIKRYFVAMPPLQSLEALSENQYWKLEERAFREFKEETKKISATALSIWFSMLVQLMGPKWLHVKPEKLARYGGMYEFYHDHWEDARRDSLEKCCKRCCNFTMTYMTDLKGSELHRSGLLFKLVRGIANPEADELTEAQMAAHSVVGFEKIITKPLVELLQIQGDETCGVWEKGRKMLLEQMKKQPELINVDKVLECAFICSSVFSAAPPQSCQKSTLFREVDGKVVPTGQLRMLKTQVLAYTDDKPCHPYVDLWIKTDARNVIIIQVTGTRNWSRVQQKCEDLEKALDLLIAGGELKNNKNRSQRKKGVMNFHALMLAPNVEMADQCIGRVSVQTKEARCSLGGLAQLCAFI